MIRIRGHHILCIEGFKGHGYSSDFVNNMKSVIKELKKNPEIMVVNFPDDICSYCLHLKDGICINDKGGEKEVKRMDRLFFEKTALIPENIYRYFDIREKIYQIFKTKKDLRGICDGCSWNRICQWYISRSD